MPVVDKSSMTATRRGVGNICPWPHEAFSTTEASCDNLGIGRFFRRGAPRGVPVRDPFPASGPVSALGRRIATRSSVSRTSPLFYL
jgi:hypothetical protein